MRGKSSPENRTASSPGFSKSSIARIALCVLVLLALCAYNLVTAQAKESQEAQSTVSQDGHGLFLKDGTFEGQAYSYGGMMSVKVTVSNGYLTDIQVLNHYDDSPYIDNVMESKIPEMKAKQSLDLDVVTNASYSSHGLLYAVRNALVEADALPDDMLTSLASSKASSVSLADTALTLDDLVGAKARQSKAQSSLSGFAAKQ